MILLAALMPAQPVQAKSSYTDLQAYAPGIHLEDLKAAPMPAEPYPADLRDSMAGKSADFSEIDTEKAELMAKLALRHQGRNFGGKCYQAVWYDVLMKAGFRNDANAPGTSAYQFAEYAKKNPEWLKNFGLKIIPTPETLEGLPSGSIVVYDPGQEDPYGKANAYHGHIEIIAEKNGTLYGCSDACANLAGTGAFLAKAAAKQHVTVFVPIK